MNKNFKYTSSIKKTNIDLYIFIICSNFKKSIENIKLLLNINKIPKKIFDDYSPKEDYEKKLILDDYEILFIALKEEKKCDNNNLYKTFGKLGKDMSLTTNKNIIINLVGTSTNIIRNQVISYMLGFYEYTEFKTAPKKKLAINYFYSSVKKIKNIVENSMYEAHIQNELRSLINIPANILNSEFYSKYIQKNIDNTIKFKVLNENKLKKIGCNLILGVNKGSSNKPMMIVLEYGKKTKSTKTIALIGKGVMFDAGGLNIKHGNFSDMKQDMTGSAIIYGIFKLLSQFNIDGHFIGLLPLVENMIDRLDTITYLPSS